MSLFWQEHKKLWRSGLTRLAAGGMLLLTLGLQIWTMQCVNFGTMRADGSRRANGYANIRQCRQYAARWQILTDETVQEMVRSYQQKLAENPDFDGYLADFGFLQGTLVSFLWPEMEDQTQPYPVLTTYYLDPDRLTGLYERRQEKLSYYLETQFPDPADRQFFLDMDSRVEKPMAYGWTAGWSAVLGNGIGGFGQMVLPVVLALALAPVFAGERRRGMDTLQATSLRGRAALAGAKLLSGLAFAGEIFTLFAAVLTAVQAVWLGFEGWDLPIQLIKMLTTAPMNMFQAECYELACLLGSALGFAGVALLLSALLPGTTAALVAALLTIWGPQILNQYLPWSVQQYLRLLPFVGGAEDIFRQNLYHWFGLRIWSPGPLLAIPLLVGAACLPAAALAWCRKRSR